MAIGSSLKSGASQLVERLQARDFASPEDRKALCEELAASTAVKVKDAVGLLFVQDGDTRRAAARLLASRDEPELLATFVDACKGKPDPAKRAAVAALASLPVAVLVAGVGRALEGGDAELRRGAAEVALELPLSSDTAPLLARVIETCEVSHRLRALTRFADVATQRNVPYFERLLSDPDERIRSGAWTVVVKFATPDKVELLLSSLPDEPYATQQLLIQALQQLVPKSGPEALPRVLGLLASGKPALRSAALKILLALPDRVGVVRAFITSSRELVGWVRDRALESLREFGPEVVGPALELTADPDPEVRSAALSLLSGLSDPRIAQVAVRLLGDPDWWIAIGAADVLGKLADQRAVPALVHALGRDEVRWAAVEALGRVGGPAALQALAGLTRDERPEIRIEALTALRVSNDARVMPLLEASASKDPVKWVRARAFDLVRELARSLQSGVDEAKLKQAVVATEMVAGAPQVHALLAMARQQGASDLHVSVDSPPALRMGGQLVRLQGEGLTSEQARALLLPLLSAAQLEKLERDRQVDACFHVENDGRYRGNIFVDRKGYNGVFRVIPDQPPTIADVGLPPWIAEVATYHQGLVLVSGPAGCGKSTTLAALVNLINETRRAHVLTLEDPVEFIHPFKNCLINQREVGKHSESFAKSVRAALRENPDVIVVGEMRDPDTVSQALVAAETGHLVLATLNATTAQKAVERIVSSFPVDEQPQVRESFADTLKIVLAQTLVPTAAAGRGRVACFEVLRCTLAIGNLIRDGKTFQIPSLMQIGQQSGMRTFDDALMELVRSGTITPQAAYMRATSKATFEPLVPPKFLEELLA